MEVLNDYAQGLADVWAHTSVWKGLNDRNREELLLVQELFILHIGAGPIPDPIRFVQTKSHFLRIFTKKAYTAATKVS
jgi:hypothetical protein